ncbi:MAG: hypothetical protein LBP56_01525 [Odoribacteraceae bacterium]|nr:hypothetical protein [Odoribacteraceae bacterium]
MKTRNFRWIISCAVVALSLFACHDDGTDKRTRRTIIAYLAADNSLNNDMSRNIDDMMLGMKQKDCRLIVYFDGFSSPPELFEIVPVGRDTAERRHIVYYPEENSASPVTLRRVLEDARSYCPADSYGLVLGSHATGWLPANAKLTTASLAERLEEEGEEKPRTRAFGEDKNSGGAQMDVREMAAAIPEGFEFIFFDACMMSSIEVFHELRAKTRYIIAPAAEIVAAGFPYAAILPYLWGDVNDLQKACEYFYNLHDKNDKNHFATITLVNAAELDGLFAVTRQVLQGKKNEVAAIPATAFPAEIFKYPRINIPNDVYFDLREFIKYMATDDQFQRFESQLKKVVIYQNITNPFWTAAIPDKSRACGISSYIPRDTWATWNTGYFQLSWAGVYQ